MRIHALDIPIDAVTKEAARARVERFLGEAGLSLITTPNPEMLVAAHKDPDFKDILQAGDLNLCDGRGITLLHPQVKERIPGADFLLDVCEIAEGAGKSVFLLGSGDVEVLENAAAVLKEKFPKLSIVGVHPGPDIDELTVDGRVIIRPESDGQDASLEAVIMAAPDIVFVGFGHGKQEKWISEYLSDVPSVRIAMGIGGSFDFYAGKVQRAPKWMRRIGIEWLWRLLHQPKRFKRIITAVIVYPYLTFKHTLTSFYGKRTNKKEN